MTLIAIIGFGEAGAAMGSGLVEAGAKVRAHDAAPASTPAGDRARARAAATAIDFATSAAEAVVDADLVLSLVVPSAARTVAESVTDVLAPGQLFVDLNSVGPRTKRGIGDVVATGAGSFVEGAILAAVPPKRHRVPIALAGSRAEDAAALLRRFGASIEVLGDEIGAAAALKMQRSLLVKGIEALFVESIAGSERYGITARVLASLDDSFPGIDWTQTARYLTSRTALHGARRARELAQVADSLVDIGVEPILATAVSRRLEWAAKTDVSDLVDGDVVDTDELWRRWGAAGDSTGEPVAGRADA